MKIAIYSGSFNPLHIGHKAIMEYLAKKFDAVYLVVSPKNPLKESADSSTARERFDAAAAAIARHPELQDKVYADDIELDMPSPQYTINTLDALKRREPDNDFTLVTGADQLADIRRWKDYRRILTEYGIAVYPRTGFNLKEIRDGLMEECADDIAGKTEGNSSAYNIRLIDAPMVDISSTQLRNAIAAGEDVSAYLM